MGYYREFGDWELKEVGSDQRNFTLKNLKCGTNYQFYIQVKIKGTLTDFTYYPYVPFFLCIYDTFLKNIQKKNI